MTATVMVVEDDGCARGAMHDLLEDAGYSVITAANGREALDHLRGREAQVRLILLDWFMPVMAGPEFLSGLISDPVHGGTPVVVLSAHDRVLASDLGVTAVVTKPVRARTLLEVIGRLAGMPRKREPTSPIADTQPLREIARTVAFRRR